jgi:hypothetical protein
VQDYNGKEETLVPGSIIGYRLFEVMPAEVRPDLGSIYYYYRWTPGVNKAECQYGCGNTPSKTCSCGFYGKYNYNLDTESKANGMRVDGSPRMMVLGAIEAYGKVILGTKGFRAENARVLGISPYYRYPVNRGTFHNLADKYKCNYYETVTDLVYAFPPPDVSSLVPEYEREERYPQNHPHYYQPGNMHQTILDAVAMEKALMSVTYDAIKMEMALKGIITDNAFKELIEDTPIVIKDSLKKAFDDLKKDYKIK